MTPLQVQFCYYIARGNAEKAQAMLPRMTGEHSLYDGTRTPAVFCLWAAKQPDRLRVLRKLAELYPDIPHPKDAIPAVPSSIEETVCKVLVPELKPHLRDLLSSILKAAPDEIRKDFHHQDGFEILSCAAALKFILSHNAFKDNTAAWQDLTSRVLKQLLNFTQSQFEDTQATYQTANTAPATVKAALNERSQTGFTKLFPTVKQTPQTPSTDDKENDFEPENENNKYAQSRSVSQGFFTSRPLHGRQTFAAHSTITPNLHGTTPPPTPKCLGTSLDLVASRPPIPFRKPSSH